MAMNCFILPVLVKYLQKNKAEHFLKYEIKSSCPKGYLGILAYIVSYDWNILFLTQYADMLSTLCRHHICVSGLTFYASVGLVLGSYCNADCILLLM
jgi:hypothetical protein